VNPDECPRCGASANTGPYHSPKCPDCGTAAPVKRREWPRIVFGAIGFALVVGALTNDSKPTWATAAMLLSAFAFLCLAFLPRED